MNKVTDEMVERSCEAVWEWLKTQDNYTGKDKNQAWKDAAIEAPENADDMRAIVRVVLEAQ